MPIYNRFYEARRRDILGSLQRYEKSIGMMNYYLHGAAILALIKCNPSPSLYLSRIISSDS